MGFRLNLLDRKNVENGGHLNGKKICMLSKTFYIFDFYFFYFYFYDENTQYVFYTCQSTEAITKKSIRYDCTCGAILCTGPLIDCAHCLDFGGCGR